MISTRYYDQRTKDVIDTLRTAGVPAAEGDTLPAVTRAVLHRWMQSVYVCQSGACALC